MPMCLQGFPSSSIVRNPPAIQEAERHEFNTWIWKTPWNRAWQPTPVLLPGESPEQRSLVGYSPQSLKESDMTEATKHSTCVYDILNNE